MHETVTAASLAGDLTKRVTDQLEHLVERYMPDWRVPRVFAGHFVAPDVSADLAFTLGFLHMAGVDSVAATPITEAISRVLRPIDGAGTHTFFSYRVAETLGRFGDLDANPLLTAWSEVEIDNIAEACDSTSWVALYDEGHLPQNYAAVLARCERARERIGIAIDPDLLERLANRMRETLERNPAGFLDDSQTRIGRYDIYTADVYLFTHPIADLLGDVWTRGARAALDLVARVGAADGSAISWGRSTGALSACLTVELGALAATSDLSDDRPAWLARAANAARGFDRWISDGLITAHQYRSTYDYRGPQRRLQMTLDCLGKLAEAGCMLGDAGADLVAAPLADAFPDRDELIELEPERNAAVWSYRSRELAFVLPLVGATNTDYLPAPHNPGTFEVPVDAKLTTGVPAVRAGLGDYAGGGLPTAIEKTSAGLRVDHDGFPVAGEMERGDKSTPLAGSRRVEYRVEGRTIHVEERLQFERAPTTLSLQITEAASRRLRTAFDSDHPYTSATVDTAGLKEYRSFWSELAQVHQIDVEPATEVTIRWSATPVLRIATSQREHHYMKAVYDPIADLADAFQFPLDAISRGGDAAVAALAEIDFFHQHWPEWLTRHDLETHQNFLRQIEQCDVRVLWTQHNLEPHLKLDLSAIYEAWAAAADGVVHHSHWGMRQSLARYRFRDDAIHRVIPHVHWGHDIEADLAAIDREAVEQELGLRPCSIRLGIMGAPRAERDVQSVIDAVHRCRRDDIGLLVTGLGDESVPDDERIHAQRYEFTSRRRYNEHLACMDVLVLPFASSGMLTTGVVGDVVGAGLPAIVSPWPYLAEALGDAGIPYDGSVDGLTEVVDALEGATLERAARASRALQEPYDRHVIARAHLDLMEEVGVGLSRR